MVDKTTEVTLRPWKPGDEAALAQIANNRKIWRNMTDRFPHPYTHDDAIAWIAHSRTEPENQRHFAICVGEQIVGGAGFTRLEDLSRRTAEIGYWLGEPFWGQGIAPRTLAMATEIAFRDFDFERLQATVVEWNDRSCRVLEKVGYELEARLARGTFKDGVVCDAWLYARLRPSGAPS